MDEHNITIQGNVHLEHWRNGELIGVHETHNDVLYYGKVRFLIKIFFPNTFTTPFLWYIGLIDATTYVESQDSDRMGEYLGWTEFSDYSIDGSTNKTTRVQWVPAITAMNGAIGNTNYSEVVAINEGMIQGIFIVDDPVFGLTNNNATMWAVAIFQVPVFLLPNDTLKMGYTVTLTNDPVYISDLGPP